MKTFNANEFPPENATAWGQDVEGAWYETTENNVVERVYCKVVGIWKR